MADVEFEEFGKFVDETPQHVKAAARSYTLVHDVAIDEDLLENLTICCKTSERPAPDTINSGFEANLRRSHTISPLNCISNTHSLKRYLGQRLRNSNDKRRKREIANFQKRDYDAPPSLAAEIEFASADTSCHSPQYSNKLSHHASFAYPNENVYSPDSEFCDSGNSTAHSPDDSLVRCSPVDGSLTGSFVHLEVLEPTHRALYKFLARHSDELELDIGDPIYVQKEAEDLWCEGINLRSNCRGIFPSAYVVDVEYNDFDPSVPQVKRERFLMKYLGSIETRYYKGNSVLCQAIDKIQSMRHSHQSCVLEVSDEGLKMHNSEMKLDSDNNFAALDYFYSMKNISCCGFHPDNPHLMGFITKHPLYERFACHVFENNDSTRLVTESIRRSFERFYLKYMEAVFPVEDIYIE